MGRARTDLPSAAAPRWPRAAVGRCARRPQRRAVGAAHRRALARPAAALSAVPNVSPPLSAVATQRPARSAAATTRRRSPGPRQTRSHRSLRGRHLRRGEKRGAAIGPTRRGSGSKIMAICDGHGLPLAVHAARASPSEPHLVPATLDARFLPRASRATDRRSRLVENFLGMLHLARAASCSDIYEMPSSSQVP